MKNKPIKAKLPVFTQLCKLISAHLVPKLAREHGIDKQASTLTPWSHVVILLKTAKSRSQQLPGSCGVWK